MSKPQPPQPPQSPQSSSKAKPHCAQKAPFQVQLEKGKVYFWCSCGLSKNQPFCDGRHKEERLFTPMKWVAKRDGEVWLCGCKATKKQPFCDGSHNKI